MIQEVIASRRAVFPAQFNDERISKEELLTILESANWAPTHRRTEPWRIKVFYSETSRLALAEFLGKVYSETADKFSDTKQRKVTEKPIQSACVLAICMQRQPQELVPEWEEIAATAMAVQNMWLTAHDMGIGAYWSSPGLKDHLYRHIALAPGESCLGFFYMGKYNGEPAPGFRNSPMEAKTVWIDS